MHRADYRPDHGDGDKQHADASEQEYEELFRIAGPPPEIHWHMYAAKQRHHPMKHVNTPSAMVEPLLPEGLMMSSPICRFLRPSFAPATEAV